LSFFFYNTFFATLRFLLDFLFFFIFCVFFFLFGWRGIGLASSLCYGGLVAEGVVLCWHVAFCLKLEREQVLVCPLLLILNIGVAGVSWIIVIVVCTVEVWLRQWWRCWMEAGRVPCGSM
jgi:hypothetical protein